MAESWFKRLALTATAIALCVVVLGAYVRLSHAGLGCPDWPGCYGQMFGVPEAEHEIQAANQAFPDRAVEPAKAWKEMIHRYLAGILGLIILAMALLAISNRHDPDQPVALPLILLTLVVFQALLGMWTVTLQLKPLIVMAHLLGGFATLSLLWWLSLGRRTWAESARQETSGLRAWAVLGLIILVAQIALGGWTSSNYAALACPDFPKCQYQWWPTMDFQEAFVLWRGLGINYEFGILDNPARTAIHVVHRLGAIVTALYLLWLGVALAAKTRLSRTLRLLGVAILALLTVQLALGISNVIFQLPLGVAVAHNGGAALLLLSIVTLVYVLRSSRVRH